MTCCHSRRCSHSRAVTLLETLVVLFIIGMMLAFSMPAVQRARTAAQNAVCKNNMHQLSIALRHYWSIKKKLPDSPQPNTVSGWAIDTLPFLEDRVLADALAGGPSINNPSIAQQISHRPLIMTCPFGTEADSNTVGVPASHYGFWTTERRTYFSLFDLPLSSRIAWVESPETNATSLPRDEGPHDLGYFVTDGRGDVRWTAGKLP